MSKRLELEWLIYDEPEENAELVMKGEVKELFGKSTNYKPLSGQR